MLRENGTKKCKQFGNEIHTEEQAQHKKAQYYFIYILKLVMEGCGAEQKKNKMLVKKNMQSTSCAILRVCC